MSAQIQVILGPDRGRSFAVPVGTTLQIGRSQVTHTHLTDATVSRQHCEIVFDGQKATLINQSDRGTLLNGQSVTQQDLRHGDVIRIGGTELRFSFTDLGEAETLLQPSTLHNAPPASS